MTRSECSLSRATNVNSSATGGPSDTLQDSGAGQAARSKRGRKPKVLRGVGSNRAPHKENWASEKHEVREERSDSESSEHGESLELFRWNTVLTVGIVLTSQDKDARGLSV